MTFDPSNRLAEGAKLLAPVLCPHGFVFSPVMHGKGSGGYCAIGTYCRQNRSLELHYRWGLGIVLYRIDDAELDHNTYMKLLNVADQSEFMRSALDKTLDGFNRLKLDIERFGHDFLSGDGIQFKALARRFKADPGMFSGFKAVRPRSGNQ